MKSKAATVDQYLAELPADRRAAISTVRAVILKNLDDGYEEEMSYGMIGYVVPHAVFPPGYHCNPKLPLPFAGLASQKNYMAVYLIPTDQAWFRKEWAKTGKKLDMGMCCIRFRKLDDLPLPLIGEAIRRTPAKAWIAHYVATMDARRGAKTPAGKRAAHDGAKPPKPRKKAAAAKKRAAR